MDDERFFAKIRQIANTVGGPLATGFISYINFREFDFFLANAGKAWPFMLALPFSYVFGLSLWLEHYGEKFGRLKAGLAFAAACAIAALLFCYFEF